MTTEQEAKLAQLRAAAQLLSDAGFPSTGRRVREIADELEQDGGI
ncbi:hypothetical protein [Gordonia sp. SND2]